MTWHGDGSVAGACPSFWRLRTAYPWPPPPVPEVRAEVTGHPPRPGVACHRDSVPAEPQSTPCPGSCLWSASSTWSWRWPSVEREDFPLRWPGSGAGSRRRAVGSRPDPAPPPVTRVPGSAVLGGGGASRGLSRCARQPSGGPCPCVGPCLGTLTLRPLPGFCAGPGPWAQAGLGRAAALEDLRDVWAAGLSCPSHRLPPKKPRGGREGWACPWQPWRQDAPGLCGWPSCWLSVGAA